MLLVISYHCFGGSQGPQPGSLTTPKRASPPVSVLILFPHLPSASQTTFQWLPASKKNVQRGSYSVDMRNTCPTRHKVFWFRANYKDWNARPSTICLTSEVPHKVSHRTLKIPRRQSTSNTENLPMWSAVSRQVSQLVLRSRSFKEETFLVNFPIP